MSNEVISESTEWIKVDEFSSDESPAPSPAPIPSQESLEKEIHHAREWDDWVVDPKKSIPFEVNGIWFYINNTPDPDANPNDKKRVIDKIWNHGKCTACTERANKFAFLIGEDGSAFLNTINHPNDGWHTHSCGSLNSIRNDIEDINMIISDPTIFIVKEGCFPEIDQGLDFGDTIPNTLTPNTPGFGKTDGDVKPFKHVTIQPSNYTSLELVNKHERLIMEYYRFIGSRLAKICVPEAIESVKIIEENLDKLERPGHWTSVIQWVKDVQKFWTTIDIPYERLTYIERYILAVYAITSPKSKVEITDETVVHKSYKQSSNIVDFLTLGSIEDVLKEMDIRSDPNNYMICQLARRKAIEKVVSPYTISLVWEGKYTDDLDIHILYKDEYGRQREIYYGNKSAIVNHNEIRLDFDANVNHGESEPCENVSVCTDVAFDIWVNNFTRRTRGDVPFTIILHNEGKSDIIIERIYPVTTHGKMFITTHTFTNAETKAPEMSIKQANRARQLNEKWEEYFGNPECIIPVVEQLRVPVNVWQKNDNSIPETVNANVGFMSMVNATTRKSQTKKYLSQIEAEKNPDTLSKLLTFMSKGSHTLEIEPRNFTPSYVTEFNTNKNIMKNPDNPYSLNHFNNKFRIPGNPEPGPGNARFTSSWFKNSNTTIAEVDSFIQFGNHWFMVVNGTKLPESNTEFPLAGGFYPTKINADVYDLRDRWAYCNTEILPKINPNGTPVIGSILTTEKATFILDGNPITVDIR